MSDPSIDVLTARLADADIDPQLRDALATDLDWATQINGHPDASMQGVKRLVVLGVRRELLACARETKIQSNVTAAIAACRATHIAPAPAQGNDALPATRIGIALTILRTLTPWRWPVAIAACSPFTSDLVIKVANLLKEIPQ